MQRGVLNTYNAVLARGINSTYFKVAPGGVKWIPRQEGRFLPPGRNLKTLAIGNNSASITAVSRANTTDKKSKSVAVNLFDTSESEEHILEFDGTTGQNGSEVQGEKRKPQRRQYITKNSLPLTMLETQILQEENVEKLLELTSLQEFTLKGACNLVFRLGQLVQDKSRGISVTAIQNNERFKAVCKLIQKGNHLQVPHSLLHAIQGLHNLGLTSGGDLLVQELENELKWSLRRCPVKFLARTIEILSKGKVAADNSQSTKTSLYPHDPLYVAIQTLQRRWTEVSTGAEFQMVFRIINHLTAETREKLEDRAVELVQDFSSGEMIQLFIAFANQKRRPTPLLRALAFHLSKSSEKIPVKDLVELMYALNLLTFADPVLMQRICGDLQVEIESVQNITWISSLATSLGQMRYMHKELLTSIEEWISKHLEELRLFDCASWLLSSSVFYLNSNRQQEFFAKAKSKLFKDVEMNPMEWLNIVHALVILDQATLDIVSSVLEPEFVKKIDSLNEGNSAARIKLLNLNAYARTSNTNPGSMEGYNGLQLTKEFVTQWASSIGENDSRLSKVVLESLSNFLPPPKYMRSGIKTECGVFIDAICMLNEKSDPVPLDSSNVKGAKKVAILVQGYPAMCLGMKVPTGSSVLNVKLLEREGYQVITVPYSEFSPKDKILRRVQYLEQKVRNIDSNAKESSLQLQPQNSTGTLVNR